MSETRTCFVISPMGDDRTTPRYNADIVMKTVLEPVREEIRRKAAIEMSFERSDHLPRGGDVIQKIVEHILADDVILAIVNERNRNVYYELGIAHSADRKVVMLYDDGEKLPFDLQSQEVIRYTDNAIRPIDEDGFRAQGKLIAELTQSLIATLRIRERDTAFGGYDPLGGAWVRSRFNQISIDEYRRVFTGAKERIVLAGASLHYFTNPLMTGWKLPDETTADFPSLLATLMIKRGLKRVTAVVMDPDNPALAQLIRHPGSGFATVTHGQVVADVRREIAESEARFSRLFAETRRVAAGMGETAAEGEVVRIRHGILPCRVTLTEREAIATPFFVHDARNSTPPAIWVRSDHDLHKYLDAEMSYLIELNRGGADRAREAG